MKELSKDILVAILTVVLSAVILGSLFAGMFIAILYPGIILWSAFLYGTARYFFLPWLKAEMLLN